MMMNVSAAVGSAVNALETVIVKPVPLYAEILRV
jgi:hypothetical protein